jgi:hypothetical protein
MTPREKLQALEQWAARKGWLLTVTADNHLLMVKPDGTTTPPVLCKRPNDKLGLEEMAKFLGWNEIS